MCGISFLHGKENENENEIKTLDDTQLKSLESTPALRAKDAFYLDRAQELIPEYIMFLSIIFHSQTKTYVVHYRPDKDVIANNWESGSSIRIG